MASEHVDPVPESGSGDQPSHSNWFLRNAWAIIAYLVGVAVIGYYFYTVSLLRYDQVEWNGFWFQLLLLTLTVFGGIVLLQMASSKSGEFDFLLILGLVIFGVGIMLLTRAFDSKPGDLLSHVKNTGRAKAPRIDAEDIVTSIVQKAANGDLTEVESIKIRRIKVENIPLGATSVILRTEVPIVNAPADMEIIANPSPGFIWFKGIGPNPDGESSAWEID